MTIQKRNRLTITIEQPVEQVFTFLLNPKNTPLWTNLLEEQTNEWPPKTGTRYKNKTTDGQWNEYELTVLEPNKLFILKQSDGNYHVRYTFTPLSETSVEVEYYEWVNKGRLADPYTQENLEKLKSVIESPSS